MQIAIIGLGLIGGSLAKKIQSIPSSALIVTKIPCSMHFP